MRRLAGAALLGAALLLPGACGGPGVPSPAVPLGTEFTLSVGSSALVAEGDLRVTFMGVENDSRCPSGVQCVWEGDAVVALAAAASGASRAQYALHTSSRFDREARHGGYQIRLVRLLPLPRAEGPVPTGDYRATLLVQRD